MKSLIFALIILAVSATCVFAYGMCDSFKPYPQQYQDCLERQQGLQNKQDNYFQQQNNNNMQLQQQQQQQQRNQKIYNYCRQSSHTQSEYNSCLQANGVSIW